MSRTPEKSYTPGRGEWYAQLKYSETPLKVRWISCAA